MKREGDDKEERNKKQLHLDKACYVANLVLTTQPIFFSQGYNAPSTLAPPTEQRALTTQTPLAALIPPASTRPERPEMRRTCLGERL